MCCQKRKYQRTKPAGPRSLKSDIREGVRKYKEKAASEAQIKADINYLKQCTATAAIGNVNSPTKAIRAQLANTAIAQKPVTQPAQNDPFGGPSGGGGNLFNMKAARPPATEAEKAILKASITLYPIQPETPDGEAKYLDQLRTWRRVSGDAHVTKATGFPLRPGGAQVGSGECYNCGRTGHRRVDCQTTGTGKIPQPDYMFPIS
jgi:hypothetical protein